MTQTRSRSRSRNRSRVVLAKPSPKWLDALFLFGFKATKHLFQIMLISGLDKLASNLVTKIGATEYSTVSDRFNHSLARDEAPKTEIKSSYGSSQYYGSGYASQHSSGSSFPGFNN